MPTWFLTTISLVLGGGLNEAPPSPLDWISICLSVSQASSRVARGMMPERGGGGQSKLILNYIQVLSVSPGSEKLVLNKLEMVKMKRSPPTTGTAGLTLTA